MDQIGACASKDAEALAASIRDPDRFAIIVERHFPAILRYLTKRVGPEAEDLTAEVFVIAFRIRHTYDTSRSDARPWLYGIATNLLRRHRRSELRQLAAYAKVASMQETVGDPSTRMTEQVAARELLRRLAQAFAQLDEEQRDALYLVGVAGLSYREAADALGVKVGTIHSRTARGREILRTLLYGTGQQRSEAITTDSSEGM